jgi:hypothetical protein
VHWRPPYDTLIRTHVKRLSFVIHMFLHNLERIMKIVTNFHVCFSNMAEGWKLRQQHLETVTSLVRVSRNFFLEGAATEIWLEFSFVSFLCGIQHECPFQFSFHFVLLWLL